MVRICLLVRFMVMYRVMSPSTIVLYVLLAAMLVVRLVSLEQFAQEHRF